jgi:hypothetical protein
LQQKVKVPRLNYSLRGYCEILFRNPSLRLYIRGKRLRPVRLSNQLYKCTSFTIRPQDGTTLQVEFGFNIRYPTENGFVFYYKNRLVTPFVNLNDFSGKYCFSKLQNN